MKFNKKKSLINLPDDKQWVLLANYYDATLIRNDLALYIGNELTSLDWTPHYQHIDFMLNGQYKGIYQLGEKVKVSKGRVNVGDDGFLMEIDQRALTEEDARYFTVNNLAMPINIKEPEVEYDDEDYNYVKAFVQEAEAVLYSDNFTDPEEGWQKYMDINSFVDWYLVNEISKNADACNLFSSCYMNLKRGGKLKMGPLWDFDIAFAGYPEAFSATSYAKAINPEGFWLKYSQWFSRFFKDPAFVAKVKERYNVIYDNRTRLFTHIDEKAASIKPKVFEDNALWGTICDTSSSVEEVESAYQEEIDNMKSWLEARLIWLYDNINAL